MNQTTNQPGLENKDAPLATNEREDAELLTAYVRGDDQAFQALVERYFGLVHGVSRRRIKDPHLAEEATQSTFIILARKASGLSNSALLRAWLLKTVHYVCNDALKSQRRRQEHEEVLEFHPEIEVAGLTGDCGGLREFLEQAVLKLPAVDQACLVARFYEGRTFKEMAGILGISDDLAQKKVSRGLQKLRRYLKKQGLRLSDEKLAGFLWLLRTPPAPAGLVHSSLRVILPAAHGKSSSGTAAALVWRKLHLLARRESLLLGSGLALPLLLVCVGWWLYSGGSWANDPAIDALGKDWSVVVLRAAVAKHTYQTRPPVPKTPEFQAYMKELQYTVKETDRISRQLQDALKPGKDRQQLAEFLTVEMRETLRLNSAQVRQLFEYVREGLSKRAELKEAMKVMAQSTSTEATEIKAYLSTNQCQMFDRVYGADGLCLFEYLKVAAA